MIALRMYVNDYDGYAPRGSYPGYKHPFWYDALDPYTNGNASKKLIYCPTAKHIVRDEPWYQNAPSIGGWQSFISPYTQPPRYVADCRNPSTAIVFADCYGYAGNYSNFAWYKGSNPKRERDMYRHNDGLNVCFFDGHGRWMSREEAQSHDEYWVLEK